MKIAVITCWYNEEKLARLFVKNHAYANKIIILLDEQSNDRTASILAELSKNNSRIDVRPISMPDGLDDSLKINAMNKVARACTGLFDWVVGLDSDEFMAEDLRLVLDTTVQFNAFGFEMFNLYRHSTELDFDPDGEVEQRQHGVLGGIKPCIVRPTKILEWAVGCHQLVSPNICSPRLIVGTHWRMADFTVAVDRCFARKTHISVVNKMRRWGHHNFDITEQALMEECKQHENDPKVV